MKAINPNRVHNINNELNELLKSWKSNIVIIIFIVYINKYLPYIDYSLYIYVINFYLTGIYPLLILRIKLLLVNFLFI